MLALTLVLLGAAAEPQDLRVVLDCRWSRQPQCDAVRVALDGAIARDHLHVVDRQEAPPAEKTWCIHEGCAPMPAGNGAPAATLFVVPAYFSNDLHVTFVTADGRVRSTLLLDDTLFDRYRRMTPSRDGALVDLVKVTTGLWVVDLVRGPQVPSDDGLDWPTMSRVWQQSLRSVVKHGFSMQPPQLGRRVVRNRRFEVRLKSVEVPPDVAPMWKDLSEAAAGRRLPDVLALYEDAPADVPAHTMVLKLVKGASGSSAERWFPPEGEPAFFKGGSQSWGLRIAMEHAELLPRDHVLPWTVTLEVTPRATRKGR